MARRELPVVPDSLIRPGLELQNDCDTHFEFKRIWSWTRTPNDWENKDCRVSERWDRSEPRIRVLDSTVLTIDADLTIHPVRPGGSRVAVRNEPYTDTLLLVVADVGGRLVVGLDSTTIADRGAFRSKAWDTLGGGKRLQLARTIRAGTARQAVHALLGKPQWTCLGILSPPDYEPDTLSDSWHIDNCSNLHVSSARTGVVSVFVIHWDTGRREDVLSLQDARD